MLGDHGLCGLLKEGAYEKSPKCLGGNLGDFGGFCKGLYLSRHFTVLQKSFDKQIYEYSPVCHCLCYHSNFSFVSLASAAIMLFFSQALFKPRLPAKPFSSSRLVGMAGFCPLSAD